MYIRLKFGRHAGEIRDIQAEAARGLLNSGRAEDPYAPAPEVRALPAGLEKFEAATEKPRRKHKSQVPKGEGPGAPVANEGTL